MNYKKLGDYITEFSQKYNPELNYPVYSVTNTNGFCTEYFNKDVSGEDKSKYKVVPRGYFAYNPSRINVGSVDWQKEEENVIVSPLYVIFKCSDILNKDYLKYFLRSNDGKAIIASKVSGSVRNNLNFKALSSIEFNIGTIDEQNLIVSRLKEIENAITNEKNQIALYDELIKARFVEMFGNPISNSKCWTQKTLGEITSKIGSGATPKGGKESYKEEGITLIRSMNVHNGRFEYKDLAHITDEQAKKLDNVTIQNSDVLLNITGASVARCCLVPNDVLPARVNQHVCIIRCKTDVLPSFVCNVLIDENYQKYLWKIAGSGATREAITKQQVENLLIIVPPLALQEQFADFVEHTNKSKVAVQKALDEAQLLFDSLMQEYFG